LFVVEWSWS